MRMAPIRVKSLLTKLRLTVGYAVYCDSPLPVADLAAMYAQLCEVCDLLDVEPVEAADLFPRGNA